MFFTDKINIYDSSFQETCWTCSSDVHVTCGEYFSVVNKKALNTFNYKNWVLQAIKKYILRVSPHTHPVSPPPHTQRWLLLAGGPWRSWVYKCALDR